MGFEKSQGIDKKKYNYVMVIKMNVYRTYKYALLFNKEQNVKINNLFEIYKRTYMFFLSYLIKQNKTFNTKELFSLLDQSISQYPILKTVPKVFLKSSIIKLKNDLKHNPELLNLTISDVKQIKINTLLVIDGFILSQNQNKCYIPFLGDLSYINTRAFTGSVSSIEIYKNKKDFYILFNAKKMVNPKKSNYQKTVGIDVGLKEFAILSDNKKIPNPRFYIKLEEQLKGEQKRLSRKKMNSNNYLRQKKKVDAIYKKIYNTRMDFLHKVSTAIVKHYDVIAIEQLMIKDMVKNKKLAKSILDASWGEFTTMLKYKAIDKGKTVIEVDRFYPSSQLCSKCGHRKLMPLYLRTFSCANCGTHIDRDYNAAVNIEKKGMDMLQKGLAKKN